MGSLLDSYLRLQAENKALKNPPLTQEERESRMLAVKTYFATMNDSQGAVSAANLYGVDYFDNFIDSDYAKELLDYLLEQFKVASILIEATYINWEILRGKLK
jgi:hypothetical protein